MSYRETEAQRLKKQLDRERQYRKQAEAAQLAAERSRAAIKGVLTKERKRVANGVCPCCNRQFSNLHRHMTTQHPGFTHEEEVKSPEAAKGLPADPPELLTVADVAKIKGVPYHAVYNAITANRLPAMKSGKRYNIARKDAEAWKR